jgi:hypothetical protein
MRTPTLTSRSLNRALLARQLLLRRAEVPVAKAVHHLLGLQAQAPMPPYYGLWSRLQDFDPHELGRMLNDREVVRMTLMRGTVHLVTARDALLLRPLLQPVIERGYNGAFRRRIAGVDLTELARATREIVDTTARNGEDPRAFLTARAIASRLIERGIGDDTEAIRYGLGVHVPLVQVPPRGVWGASGQAKYATLESWTGCQLEAQPNIEEVVLRYLRAFGPASVMDVQNWSGLTRCKPVLERLRPQLVTFRHELGKELFDLPDAPRPDPDLLAPVRLLGEFDNVLLGHSDRRRIIPSGALPWMDILSQGRHVNNMLVDGMLRATWWIERQGTDRATLAIRPIDPLTGEEQDEVESEARRMLDFAAADAAAREIRFDAAPG